MTKGNSEHLAIQELTEVIKNIGKLRADITVGTECLPPSKWLSNACLLWSDAWLKATISLIGVLCTGLDAEGTEEENIRPSSFFEQYAKVYPQEAYVSLYDLKNQLIEINAFYFATKISYAKTQHPLYLLWEDIDVLLNKARLEIQNSINAHK
jgi:hypothetical protein